MSKIVNVIAHISFLRKYSTTQPLLLCFIWGVCHFGTPDNLRPSLAPESIKGEHFKTTSPKWLSAVLNRTLLQLQPQLVGPIVSSRACGEESVGMWSGSARSSSPNRWKRDQRGSYGHASSATVTSVTVPMWGYLRADT